jgi:hypothetical protein
MDRPCSCPQIAGTTELEEHAPWTAKPAPRLLDFSHQGHADPCQPYAAPKTATCPFRKLYPDVLVVQSSQNKNGDDGARVLSCPMRRRVLVYAKCVRASALSAIFGAIEIPGRQRSPAFEHLQQGYLPFLEGLPFSPFSEGLPRFTSKSSDRRRLATCS